MLRGGDPRPALPLPPGPAGRDAIKARPETRRPGATAPARIWGAVLQGVVGEPVEVEVRLSSMLPRIDLVGLPEAAVRESAARVRAAIQSLGVSFPDRRVTVNLAPAALPKSGAGLDLPIAVGILAASGHVSLEGLADTACLGELALDGRVRSVRGALALARALVRGGCPRAIVPAACAGEAAFAPGAEIFGAQHLSEVVEHLATGRALAVVPPQPFEPSDAEALDVADVRGQERGKRALVIAAAGGHGLFFSGPPGAGKTMLARRLSGLLPAPTRDEALEVTEVHSAAGLLPERGGIVRTRPFRAPHHAASRAGLLGGGSPPRPGEVSLAHRGVLFLDEFPEFERGVREALRQVVEERRVVVSRARGSACFPADFQLVAAANPCPCGWWGSRWRPCECDDTSRRRYRARLAGPLLDRIDLSVSLESVAWRDLDGTSSGAGSAALRAQVDAARAAAAERLRRCGARHNAEIPDAALDEMVDASPEARTLLGRAVDRLRLSARGARRVLRVARTLADLHSEPRTGPEALAEALSFRGENPPR